MKLLYQAMSGMAWGIELWGERDVERDVTYIATAGRVFSVDRNGLPNGPEVKIQLGSAGTAAALDLVAAIQLMSDDLPGLAQFAGQPDAGFT
jgi:hypothetical protein